MPNHNRHHESRQAHPVLIAGPGTIRVRRTQQAADTTAHFHLQYFMQGQVSTPNMAIQLAPPFRVLLPRVYISGDATDQYTFGYNGIWAQRGDDPGIVLGLFGQMNMARTAFSVPYVASVSAGALIGWNDIIPARGRLHPANAQILASCQIGAGTDTICGPTAQWVFIYDMDPRHPNRITLQGGAGVSAMYDFVLSTLLIGGSAFAQIQFDAPLFSGRAGR